MTDAARIDQDNPLGVDGFEFVEFTGPEPEAMVARLELMGFTRTHVNPANNVVRLKQGDITMLVNLSPKGQAGEFATDHGPSANGMAFRVADAKAAFEGALQRGARKAEGAAGGALGNDYPYILQGIGGSLLYVIDQYGEHGSLYEAWDEIEGWEEAERKNSMGLGEAHQLQPGDHGFRLRAGEFDEFETVHAQRVFLVEFGGGVLHDASPLSILVATSAADWGGT